ncbi:hypothetical protein SRB5_46490 [Streptomyces sp. RB5]|uniref:Secreted protein n=1 Tax=Streptomyces smaragdinus TaxID=2585196 RepID=A0A7K0CN70_9ACTN|nr:hypothetical protein [Streptomyces smaragdinus]MQY14482.1 hypothetical protein [Streptomyces smaragdinus]
MRLISAVGVSAALLFALTACGGSDSGDSDSASSAEPSAVATDSGSDSGKDTGSEPDLEACKAALAKQFADESTENASRPPECDGVDNKAIGELTEEVFKEEFDKLKDMDLEDLDTATP